MSGTYRVYMNQRMNFKSTEKSHWPVNGTTSGPSSKNATSSAASVCSYIWWGLDRATRAKFRALISQMQLCSLNRTALAHQRSNSDPRSLYSMFCCFLCIIVQCWKIFEQPYFIERNRNIYGVWLQACKQQKYLKNPLFCYWSKGVLETLLWQQFLPSGRSMPLSVHRNKTRGGVFQNCCPPPLDHYRCADLLAWAPAAGAFNEI